MSEFLREPSKVFPRAIGNEEETGLIFKLESRDEWVELDEFDHEYFELGHSDDLAQVGSARFLKNGMKFYPGGAKESSGPTNPERVTPECRSPEEVAAYIAVGRSFVEDHLEEFIKDYNETSLGDRIEQARLLFRVRDSNGSTKACHDSFDMHNLNKANAQEAARSLMLAHVLTRPIVTGSGFVDGDGSRYYAQKMQNIDDVYGKSYSSTLLQTYDDENRLEVRCGDQNTSQWATRMRVGSTALVLAFATLPHAKELAGELETIKDELAERHVSDVARDYNSVGDTAYERVSLEVQSALVGAIDDSLPKQTVIPDEYQAIIAEWRRFIDDATAVVDGAESLSILAGRADWATKFAYIDKRQSRRKSSGGLSSGGVDYASMMHDMRYDMVEMLTGDDGSVSRMYGWGKDYFRNKPQGAIPQSLINTARIRPPETRALLRTQLLEDYRKHRFHCIDWGQIHFGVEVGSGSVYLPSDPLSTILPRSSRLKLESLEKYGIVPHSK